MNLETTYMGLELSSPVVVSASPLSEEIANIRQMEDCGAGAVVLFSLFEEQIQHEANELEFYLHYGADRFPESLTYFPDLGEYRLGAEDYLDHICKAHQAVDMPVIASLNGISTSGWVRYATEFQEAGADAIELNVYYVPTVPQLDSQQVEQTYLDVLQAVKQQVDIPVAMKLSPFFSSPANVITTLDKAGADGFVLFNRFYQPDIDLQEMAVATKLTLSEPVENLLPMRWIAIMYGKVSASLAASTGIHSAEDVMKMLLAGADVAMLCSVLLKKGVGYITDIRDGLVRLMQEKEYESLSQLRGSISQQNCANPDAFERANYLKILHSYGLTSTFE